MAWKDISSTVVKYSDTMPSNLTGRAAVCLQYDDSSENPESVKVRFKYYRHDGGSGNLYDEVYILYNANDSVSSIGNLRRTLFKIKNNTSGQSSISWPFYSEAFTIKKTYTTDHFSLQDFWICNNGNNATTATASNFASVWRYTSGWAACHVASQNFSISGTAATNGTVVTPTIKDNGNNTFTLSGSYSAGSHNAFKSGKIYYTTNGSTPTTSSASVAISGGTINVPSGASSSTVKAFAYATFTYNTASSGVATKTVYYYSPGTKAAKPVITDLGNNTFTISGVTGKGGSNTSLANAILHYTINGISYTEAFNNTIEGITDSVTLFVPEREAASTVTAYLVCEYKHDITSALYNTTVSDTASATVYYHTAIGRPTIDIKDNGNNTFTITGTAAANGTNNNASTSYQWGYTTNYGTAGAGTKNLTIATPSDATRTVYARATATPSWSGDSAKTAAASLAIKQYVAPTNPGTPILSYTKNRLTIKEPLTFTWAASSQANSSSPVKGYRIRLYKNGSLVMGLSGNTSSDALTIASTGLDYFDRENTSCTVTVDPITFDLKAGDTIQLGIFSYTRNGVGTQLFNSGGTAEAQVFSSVSTIGNAGIVNVRVNGTWQEGQVYVKVDGSWREAETVNTKVNGVWKESQ